MEFGQHSFDQDVTEAELADKSEKLLQRASKKKADRDKPRKVNKAALSKKIEDRLRKLELQEEDLVVSAEEAVRIGLALRSVPLADLESTAREVAASCATAAPGAVSGTKALLRDAMHHGGWARAHDDQLADERAAQGVRIREMVAMLMPR